jgi:hypothetical protein
LGALVFIIDLGARLLIAHAAQQTAHTQTDKQAERRAEAPSISSAAAPIILIITTRDNK